VDFITASNDYHAGLQAASYYFNEQQALQLLNASKACLTQSAQCVVLEVQYGFESKAQGQSDLAIINQAYNEVNQAIQSVDYFFTGYGGHLNYLPNYFAGANLLN
jgi:hypothetical protein